MSQLPHLSEHPNVLKPNAVRKWIRTHFLEPTLKKTPRGPGVLDLCCGYGFYFNINPEARGVDGDPNCVAALRAEGRSVELANVLEPLPYPAGEFSHVIAHDVLEHFFYEQLEKIFPEVHRILAPSGRFVVLVPNRRGYDFGLEINAGHRLFVRREHIDRLRQGLFDLEEHYPEPFPRWLGEYFVHNKEVFILRKSTAPGAG